MRDWVYNDFTAERDRQDRKWGDQSHLPDLMWMAILMEEVGEAAKEIIDGRPDNNLEEELVQVGAVVTAWLEALAKRKATNDNT